MSSGTGSLLSFILAALVILGGASDARAACCSPCSSVVDTSVGDMSGQLESGFRDPYVQGLRQKYDVLLQEKLRPGSLAFGDEVTRLCRVTPDLGSRLDGLANGAAKPTGQTVSTTSAQMKLSALQQQSRIRTFLVAKGAYQTSKRAETSLRSFAPARMDFGSADQAVKDTAKLTVIHGATQSETLRLLAALKNTGVFNAR